MKYAMVVTGASLGGLAALKELLSALPKGFALPLVLVQHRSDESTDTLQFVLQDACLLPLREAVDKAPIESGVVYLAPPGYHLLVEGGYFSLSTEPPVLQARPSIDVLFETAAQSWGKRLIGIVLTGTGQDGARGLAAVQRHGGLALVESPSTALAAAMPAAALQATHGATELDVHGIGAYLSRLGRA